MAWCVVALSAFASPAVAQIVSDDFNTCGLDLGVWTFINPRSDAFYEVRGVGTPDARIDIFVPGGPAHDPWTTNTAPRIMQPATNGDFQLETKLLNVLDSRFQSQGILVEQDATNFLRFDFVSTGSVVRVFAARLANGSPTVQIDQIIASGPSPTPLYLRITRQGNQWTEEYSLDGTSWTVAGSFTDVLTVNEVGIYGGNAHAGEVDAPTYTASFDYFFNTALPISPEDAPLAGGKSLTVTIDGPGTVTVEPDQTLYYCTDVVTLTAVPDLGQVFSGWSQDLTGVTNPETITMPVNRQVTATFGPNTTPPIINNLSVTPHSSWAELTWETNELATSRVDWSEGGCTSGCGLPFPSDLVLAYGFDEASGSTVIDNSGNGNDGTLNGATRNLAGYRGPAAEFDGVAGDVSLPGIDLSGTGLTIAMWVKIDTFPVQDVRLISRAQTTSGQDHYWMISTINSDRLRFRLKTDDAFGTSTLIADGALLSTDVWTHVAVTYDGGQMRIFQDGSQVGSLAKTGLIVDAPAVAAVLGDHPGGGGKTFDGLIDDVRIYNRALSQGEIVTVRDAEPYANTVEDPALVTEHAITLTGLTPNTLYNYRVGSTDVDLMTSFSPNDSFSTIPFIPGPVDSDDFNACTLDPVWTWIDPLGDSSYTITGVGDDATINIHVPEGLAHDPWAVNDAPRLMQPTANSNFQLEVKLTSVVNDAFQEQGLIIEDDANHWLRFDFVANGNVVRAFAASVLNGVPTPRISTVVKTVPSDTPMWLRVGRVGDVFTMQYSSNGTTWTTAGTFAETMTVTSSGIYAGTFGGGGPAPAHTASFDYFTDTSEPVPDDVGAVGGKSLTVNLNGSGSVIRNPDRALYYCGEEVELTAVADPGQVFTGWGGALTGITNPITVAVADDTTVDANFSPDTAPPVLADIAVDARDTWATVTWVTNEPADARVDWGLTSSYTSFASDATISTMHSLVLTGLDPDTEYHFQVTSEDEEAASTSSSDLTFTTTPFIPGPFLSDDFNDCALDTGIWTFINPLGDASYSISGVGTEGARLTIHIPGGTSHDPWTENNAPRMMQPASNTDFQIEVKMESDIAEGNQEHGILIEQDADRWMRFDFYSNGTSVNAFAALLINGVPTVKINELIKSGASPIPLWLRVTRTGDVWTHEWSSDGTTWNLSGSFVQPLIVSSVGFYGGNFAPDGNAPEHTAVFDYFFDTSTPKVPEDGVRPGGQTLTVNVGGNGNVVRNPDRAFYYCNEPVTLTAVPGEGSSFSNWTGALFGSVNPESLTMDADKAVTANFSLAPGPPVIGSVNVVPRDTFATFTWTTNEPATSRVNFGPTAAYGSFVEDLTLSTEHELVVTGLTEETLYHFSVSSTDNQAFTSNTADATFVTTPPDFQSDDFNSDNLNTGIWTFVNPLGDGSYSIGGVGSQDARLSIHVPAGVSHDPWVVNEAPRLMQPTNDSDLQIEIKVDSIVSLPNQEQGILIEEDENRWLRFDFVSTPTRIIAFAARVVDGVPAAKIVKEIGKGSSQTPMYLRVTRIGDEFTHEYSFDGETWLLAGSFTEVLAVQQVGIFGGNFGNRGNTAPAHTAVFDYFMNTEFPLPAEDGGVPPTDTTPPLIQVIDTSSSETFFRVSWKTDEPATGIVEYGLDDTYQLGTEQAAGLSYDHEFQINGLTTDTVYHFRLTSEDGAGNTTVTGDLQILVQGIQFDIFYGSNQTAGYLGNPQVWVDVLGNVTDPDGITSLTYTLNGGPPQDLSLGPDNRRKARQGDFVLELDPVDLLDGPNQIELTAVDSIGTIGTEMVTVDYQSGNVWPRNYSIDWSTVTNIHEVAHVVDGNWEILPTGLHIKEVDYDRIVAIGDMSWTDYQIEVPITPHAVDTTGYGPPSGGPGIGIALRWNGHVDWDGSQPRWGHWPLGAIAWYRWKTDWEKWRLAGNEFIAQKDDPYGRVIELGTTYIYKGRVVTDPETGIATYSVKIWKQSDPEPSTWDIEILVGPDDGPASGSVLLLAHHVDATFGNVTITNLDCTGPGRTLTRTVTGGGTINADPDLEFYHCDEIVTLTADPDPGWQFAGWSGDVTGVENPDTLNMTDNRSVTATFVTAPGAPVIDNIQVSPGDTWATVTWKTNEPASSRVDYGQTMAYELGQVETPILVTRHSITLTGLNPSTEYHFRAQSADSDSMNTTSGDATFTTTAANGGAFESDDFNACTLDTSRWTFVDPQGGATVSVGGAGADAKLTIDVPGGAPRNPFGSLNAPRLRQLAANTDFQAEIKFDSPLGARFQSQGLLVEQDSVNWLRFDFNSDGSVVRAFAAETIGGVSTSKINEIIPTSFPLYLRITRIGDQWIFERSTDGASWQSPGSFVASLNVSAISIFAGNAEVSPGQSNAPAHTAVIDYFFNTASFVDPEDGGVPGTGRVLNVTTTGNNGRVTVDPQQKIYYCDETVTLTAVPDPGSAFNGWSGDLSGFVNPATVVMSANRTVNADFQTTEGPPVMFNVVVDQLDKTATISWTTNEPATTRIDWGETAGYGSFIEDLILKTAHSVELTGLVPETLYHYQLSGVDEDTMLGTAPDATFTTLELIPGPFRSDDFNVCTLDAGVWTWIDPLGDSTYSVSGAGTSDATLTIDIPVGLSHDPWSTNEAPRFMQAADDEDMQIEVKFDSVLTQQYQSQGVIVEQDVNAWLRLSLHSDGAQVFAFAASVINGAPAPKFNVPLGPTTPPWMRVTRTGTLWTMETSQDGVIWDLAGSFTDALTVTQVGVFGGNFSPGGVAPAHTAIVDYFFDTGLPIVPEDGGLASPGRSLTVNVVGDGTVDRDPDAALYYCDDLVTLTVTPDPGWVFGGWSGDLNGIGNPGTILMTADRNVTATFSLDNQPPIIDTIQVSVSPTTATISWVTNEPATSRVDYGTTPVHDQFVEDPTLRTQHSLVLNNLTPGLEYHFSVTSVDADTMSTSSPDDTFMTPSALPGSFLSDDFDAPALDTGLWTFVDPLGDASATVGGSGTADAWLSITVPGGVSHDPWASNDAPRIMQAASDGDFQAEVKFESVLSQRYQSQGIIVEQDSDDWMRFDIHSNGSTINVLAASIIGGSPGVELMQSISAGASQAPMWLRVTRTIDQWTVEHSTDGQNWTVDGTFSHSLSVTAIGVFGGNFASSGNAPAHTAIFDYFFDTSAPIDPEDTP